MEIFMKNKLLLLVLVFGLIFSACSTNNVVDDIAVEMVEEEIETQAEESVMEVEEVMEVSFLKDLLPVLEKFASQAHGSSGGVNLETYENVLKVVVPGSPEESRLYKHLTGDGVPVMPPSGKLDDETIQLFYDWIAAGAKEN